MLPVYILLILSIFMFSCNEKQNQNLNKLSAQPKQSVKKPDYSIQQNDSGNIHDLQDNVLALLEKQMAFYIKKNNELNLLKNILKISESKAKNSILNTVLKLKILRT